MKTGIKPRLFDDNYRLINLNRIFRQTSRRVIDQLVCKACVAATNGFIIARRSRASKSMLQKTAVQLCVSFNIENEEVCSGVIESNINIFLYIIDNKKGLFGDRICSIVLQDRGCGTVDSTWKIKIPQERAPPVSAPSTGTTFKILHLTDFHLDNLYTPGGNARCDAPLCCQSDQGNASIQSDACGYWGDYRNGDAPLHSVENVFDEAVHHDFDVVYFTGDIVSHRVWSTSVEGNRRDLQNVYGLLGEKFRAPIFPILGNHEPHPLNA